MVVKYTKKQEEKQRKNEDKLFTEHSQYKYLPIASSLI